MTSENLELRSGAVLRRNLPQTGARNNYCSNCLSTRRFYDVGDHYECECCKRELHKAAAKLA